MGRCSRGRLSCGFPPWGTQGECGAAGLIVLFLITAVLTALIGVGFDAVRARYGSVAVRAIASKVCRLTADELVLQRNAATTFFALVDAESRSEALPWGVRLSSARLTIPLGARGSISGEFPALPASSIDGIPDQYLPPTHGVPADPDLWEAPACDALQLSGGQCLAFCAVSPARCRLRFWPGADSPYPRATFIEGASGGNTVGCEVRAEFSPTYAWVLGGILGGNAEVLPAVVAEWLPPLGARPSQVGVTGEPIDLPGLLIGVSTSFTIPAGSPTASRFAVPPGKLTSLGMGQLPTTTPIFQGTLSGALPSSGSTIPPVSLPPGSTPVFDVRQCLNRPALVRNLFLATIVELASRHGELRNRTEIVHVNPRDRSLQEPYFPPPSRPSWPSLMVRFGEDLSDRIFELPYLYYFGGAAGAYPPLAAQRFTGDTTDNGVPFSSPAAPLPPPGVGFVRPNADGSTLPGSGTTTDNAWRVWEWALSAQLRVCQQLYRQGGLTRVPVADVAGGGGPNFGFEDPTQFAWRDKLWAPPTGAGSLPWIDAPTAPFPAPNCLGDSCQRLTAGELVATLGTSTRCPVSSAAIGVPNTAGGTWGCQAPYDARSSSPDVWKVGSRELRPDLVGFLLYAAGKPTARIGQGPGAPTFNVYALNRGLMSFDSGSLAPLQDPNPSRRTTVSPPNSFNSILLVTHQRLDLLAPPTSQGFSEVCHVRRLVTGASEPVAAGSPCPVSPPWQLPVTSSNFDRRPITVVYIPTAEVDAFENGPPADEATNPVDVLRWSFNSPLGSPDTSQGNQVVVFSPYSEEYRADKCFLAGTPGDPPPGTTTRGWCFPAGGGSEDSIFQGYWDALLNPTNSEYVVNKAKEIFYLRLLRRELRL